MTWTSTKPPIPTGVRTADRARASIARVLFDPKTPTRQALEAARQLVRRR